MLNDPVTAYLSSKLIEMLRVLDTNLNQCVKLMDQENYTEAKLRIVNIEKAISNLVFKLTLNLSNFEDGE